MITLFTQSGSLLRLRLITPLLDSSVRTSMLIASATTCEDTEGDTDSSTLNLLGSKLASGVSFCSAVDDSMIKAEPEGLADIVAEELGDGVFHITKLLHADSDGDTVLMTDPLIRSEGRGFLEAVAIDEPLGAVKIATYETDGVFVTVADVLIDELALMLVEIDGVLIPRPINDSRGIKLVLVDTVADMENSFVAEIDVDAVSDGLVDVEMVSEGVNEADAVFDSETVTLVVGLADEATVELGTNLMLGVTDKVEEADGDAELEPELDDEIDGSNDGDEDPVSEIDSVAFTDGEKTKVDTDGVDKIDFDSVGLTFDERSIDEVVDGVAVLEIGIDAD